MGGTAVATLVKSGALCGTEQGKFFFVDAAAVPVVPGGGGPAKRRGTSLILGYNSVPQPPTAVAFL